MTSSASNMHRSAQQVFTLMYSTGLGLTHSAWTCNVYAVICRALCSKSACLYYLTCNGGSVTSKSDVAMLRMLGVVSEHHAACTHCAAVQCKAKGWGRGMGLGFKSPLWANIYNDACPPPPPPPPRPPPSPDPRPCPPLFFACFGFAQPHPFWSHNSHCLLWQDQPPDRPQECIYMAKLVRHHHPCPYM